MSYYLSQPLVLVPAVFILGLLIGSFLNVVIYRLPKMMEDEWRDQCCDLLEQPKPEKNERFDLLFPASTCPECGHKIRPWENIPVISYLFLKGACSKCKTKISIRYPLVELATGVLSGFAALYFGFTPQLLAVLILTWTLISLTMIDVDHQLLPDSMTLPLMWLGLLLNSGAFFGVGLFTDLHSSLYGAMAGYLSLWSVYWLFKLITKKEGMGFGDFKLLAALGAWMGWQYLVLIILLSSAVGAILGIGAILLQGRDKAKPIPFGPYLAIAGWIALLWGEEIITRYLQMAQVG
ncbi:prepilin peptidase [Marinibactrum halimedae]|uniref:Prepilin leader peptidase/N-methyltransferase n=1 Tax=Marinibactrum halimedae TaxID=1444977 RepID=A0AA37WR25_9GAMM|nr:A24 family peptidase [Marinibactrum halimedae]MCD9460230.1 A24 family peptidase [Marinibactrum halimedae]GLS27937.1 type 4 prepilin-like proteins leader peptide-processing enzyme [Marinibactrum halimedae]